MSSIDKERKASQNVFAGVRRIFGNRYERFRSLCSRTVGLIGARQKPKSAAMDRGDQEFLPAALEILERPASPLGMGIIYFVVLVSVAAVLWSWFSWTDIVAVGSGKVQPAGRVKTIQVSEIGRVRQILAANGQFVKAGDAVAEVESQDAEADQEAVSAMFYSSSAEITRRNRAIQIARDPDADNTPIKWPNDIPIEFTALQERVLADELAALRAQLGAIEAQKAQKSAEAAKTSSVVAAQKELLRILEERVQMRRDLVALNDVSRAQLMEAQEAFAQQNTSHVAQIGALAEIERAITVLESEAQKIRKAFVAENVSKLAEAERNRIDAAAKLVKTGSRLARMVLRSPVDGIVHGTSLTTVGQVLSPGAEIMRIVPEGQRLEIEVYFPNKEIGFISVGQLVAIKVEAFPFTRYGTLTGKVMRVARDAVPEADVRQTEADASRAVSSQEIAGSQRVQGLVYPVVIEVPQTGMNINGRSVDLVPGMAVTAEIKTGKRRVLEYLFAPLVEVTNRAMRER